MMLPREDYDPQVTLIPDYGDKFSLEDFLEMVKHGSVTAEDGTGHYSDGVQMFHEIHITGVLDSIERAYPYIIWFNK